MNDSVIEQIVRRDKLIVLGAVAMIVLLSGIYTVAGVGMNMSALEMTSMAKTAGGMMMQNVTPATWTPAYITLVLLMWWVMMIAMMTPSAAPAVLLFTALKRIGHDRQRTPIFSAMFLAGYLVIWALFAVVATFLQWGLGTIGLVSNSMMTISSNTFAAIVLVGAGVYQFSGLKSACLKHCRSPAAFLSKYNRPGLIGAIGMGARHGTYCLGCCWALMALLFVGGVMNLYWIVGLAIYVLVEKTFPYGDIFAKITGAILILSGGLLLVSY